MAVQQTAETGHDITLATHLAKNFDGYGEELKARVRDFVIVSMSQPDGGARRFNIDRTGQVTSSGQVTSTRADFTLTVWLGSNYTGRQTLHGSIRPNDDGPEVLIRHAERRQGDTRAQFVRKFLSGLSKEIRAQAEGQLNSAFEGEVIA